LTPKGCRIPPAYPAVGPEVNQKIVLVLQAGTIITQIPINGKTGIPEITTPIKSMTAAFTASFTVHCLGKNYFS